MRYNLGCGKKRLDGYINLDKNDLNLEKEFKLKDCSYILLENSLEHCSNRLDIVNRLREQLNNNGVLEIHLPVFSPRLEHKSSINTSCYFDGLNKDLKENLEEGRYFDIDKKYVYRDFKGLLHTIFKLLQILFVKEIKFKLKKK